MQISLILLLSVLSSVFYRAGGMSQESQEKWSKWIPKAMRHSWVRDWLCPLCMYLLWFPGFNLGLVWWLLLYGATGGMLTTYWDWLFNDVDNFWFAGFMVGLAGLFLIALGVPWWLLLARSVVLGIAWGGWCAIFGDADVEEYGRGAFLVLTMAILL